jgi:hypothetical protein
MVSLLTVKYVSRSTSMTGVAHVLRRQTGSWSRAADASGGELEVIESEGRPTQYTEGVARADAVRLFVDDVRGTRCGL